MAEFAWFAELLKIEQATRAKFPLHVKMKLKSICESRNNVKPAIDISNRYMILATEIVILECDFRKSI